MTTDDFEVRDRRGGDAEGIARLHVDSWRETYSGLLGAQYFGEDV